MVGTLAVAVHDRSMTETVITVQGTYDPFHRAERATVTVTAGFEGPEGGPVVAGTTQGSSVPPSTAASGSTASSGR
jgi:hypothetical protein